MTTEELICGLNAGTKEERLSALKELVQLHQDGTLPKPEDKGYVNSHIHTTYSFSPYSPTKAVYTAWTNGLTTAGIVDHDSVGGTREFIEAGKITGMITTIGMECRVSFADTPFADLRLNNPDQIGCAYVLAHGIPHQNIDRLAAFMQPYRVARNERNKKMVANINALVASAGISMDFEKDVVPASNWVEGGSVTERHILYVLAQKITDKTGKGQPLIDFLQEQLGLALSAKQTAQMLDTEYAYYHYDLLGILKSSMVEKIYVPATDECPPVREFLKAIREIGAVTAYAYLGDVGDSVTGDKKTQKFEDDYLDQLIPYLKELGFDSIAYMPSRNTLEQLQRLMKLCKENDLFEISGEDINSPRQAFINDKIKEPAFAHLIDATWTLIGHEKEATKDLAKGMFTEETKKKMPSIEERIQYYAKAGQMQEE